jgi:hypothetical protein
MMLGEFILEFAPDHHLNDAFPRHVVDRCVPDVPAVSQHHDPIGNTENFV